MNTLAEEKQCYHKAVVNKGFYAGNGVTLNKSVDLGDLGVWYFTEDIPNYYTEEWGMWFKQSHLEFN